MIKRKEGGERERVRVRETVRREGGREREKVMEGGREEKEGIPSKERGKRAHGDQESWHFAPCPIDMLSFTCTP
jgi:hypothetical protein